MSVVEYGFVPKNVLDDLQDIGNWKSRASGIDKLAKALQDVQDTTMLQPDLAQFVAFLNGLILDPNFKIALSSLQILGNLISKVGRSIEPSVKSIVPTLIEKFADSKVMVRTANLKVLKQLNNLVGASRVVDLMAGGLRHQNWVVREGVVNACIMTMVQHRQQNLNSGQLFNIMCAALVDSKERVRDAGLEGMAALSSCAGSAAFLQMLTNCNLKEPVKAAVRQRLKNPMLPVVSPEGMVAMVDAPSSAASSGTAGGPGLGGGDASGSPSNSVTSSVAGGAGWAAQGPTPSVLNGLGGNARGRLMGERKLGELPWEAALGGGGGSPGPPLLAGSSAGSPAMSGAAGASARSGHAHHPLADSQVGLPPDSALRARLLASNNSPTPVPAGPRQGLVGASASSRMESMMSDPIPSSGPLGFLGKPANNSFLLIPEQYGRDGSSGRSVGRDANVNKSYESSGSDLSTPLTPSYHFQQLYHNGNGGAAASGGGGQLGFLGGANQPPALHIPGQGGGPPGGLLSPKPYGAGHLSAQQPGSPWMSGYDPTTDGLYSPSKGQLLANLKRRQEEKRAISAQLPERPALPPQQVHELQRGGPYDSPMHHGGHGAKVLSTDSPMRAPGGGGGGGGARSDGSTSLSFDAYQQLAAHGSRSSAPAANAHPGKDGPPSSERPSAPRSERFSHIAPSALAAAAAASSSGSSAEPPPLLAEPLSAPLGSRLGRAGSRPRAALGALRPPRNGTAGTYDDDGGGPEPPASAGGFYGPLSGGGGGQYDAVRLSSPTRYPSGQAPDSPGVFDKSGSKLDELSNAELQPLTDPERSARAAIQTCQTANNAGRKEIDWQGQYEALNDLRRLVKFHPDVVQRCLHEFVCAAIPAVDALRSSTVKNALILFQEAFGALGRLLDRELDEIVPVLLKRSGEVSNAGRENFITSEADRTLAEMCRNVSEARAVSALVAQANHKSPPVRCRVASHLDSIVEHGIGSGLQGNWPCLEKLFKATVGFLNEGALETRTYAKRILWNIRQSIGRGDFERMLQMAGLPAQKKVLEVLEGMNGPPPPPAPPMGSRPAGSRMVSRGPGGQAQGPGPGGLSPMRGGSFSAPVGAHSIGGQQAPPGRPGMAELVPTPTGSRNSRGVPHGGGVGGSGSGGHGSGSGGYMAAAATSALMRVASGSDRSDGVAGGSRAGQPHGRTPPRAGSFPRDSAGPLTRLDSGSRAADGYGGHGGGGGSFGPAAQESLSKAVQLLSAKDFRDRIEGLSQVEAIAQALTQAPEGLLMQLLDNMTIRLGDGNSKVNVKALETLGLLFEVLRERVALGLNTLVPAVAANLGSANEKTRQVAMQTADKLVNSVDPSLLVQNFSHCVSNGTARGKLPLAEKLEAIINALYQTRPQLVVKYAVPAALSLANDTKGGAETKAAANLLLLALARNMGQQLMDYTSPQNQILQQRVHDIVASVAYY